MRTLRAAMRYIAGFTVVDYALIVLMLWMILDTGRGN